MILGLIKVSIHLMLKLESSNINMKKKDIRVNLQIFVWERMPCARIYCLQAKGYAQHAGLPIALLLGSKAEAETSLTTAFYPNKTHKLYWKWLNVEIFLRYPYFSVYIYFLFIHHLTLFYLKECCNEQYYLEVCKYCILIYSLEYEITISGSCSSSNKAI